MFCSSYWYPRRAVTLFYPTNNSSWNMFNPASRLFLLFLWVTEEGGSFCSTQQIVPLRICVIRPHDCLLFLWVTEEGGNFCSTQQIVPDGICLIRPHDCLLFLWVTEEGGDLCSTQQIVPLGLCLIRPHDCFLFLWVTEEVGKFSNLISDFIFVLPNKSFLLEYV